MTADGDTEKINTKGSRVRGHVGCDLTVSLGNVSTNKQEMSKVKGQGHSNLWPWPLVPETHPCLDQEPALLILVLLESGPTESNRVRGSDGGYPVFWLAYRVSEARRRRRILKERLHTFTQAPTKSSPDESEPLMRHTVQSLTKNLNKSKSG